MIAADVVVTVVTPLDSVKITSFLEIEVTTQTDSIIYSR